MIAVALTLWFWLGFIPAVYQDADAIRATQLRQRQQQIEAALEACRRDTGGVPARRLAVLQQYGVKAGDMTAGAKPGQWRGPYLPGGAFPLNPFRPQDGSAGWRYTTNGDEGSVAPAHMQP